MLTKLFKKLFKLDSSEIIIKNQLNHTEFSLSCVEYDNNLAFDNINYARLSFCFKDGLELGRAQAQHDERCNRDEYYITGVGTNYYCTRMGFTSLYLSWIILYLLRCFNDKPFSVKLDNGAMVVGTEKSTGKYIYKSVFDPNNPNVTLNEHEARRVFPIDSKTRQEDYTYFSELLSQKALTAKNNYSDITILSKENNVLRIQELDEANEFVRKYYSEWNQDLSDKEISLICHVQSHSISNSYDPRAVCEPLVIEAMEKAFSLVPECPRDLVLYRSGEMHFKNRPYISASFCRYISLNYDNNPHLIIARKGSRFVPLASLNPHNGEAEVLLASSKLKKHKNHYEYL